ncbi:sulfotransferase [Aliiglaciecola sp. 3_MG-2023]|uniref:tetratricopeptide repeat-containing sulfotransferase family protein n=1 Tax=Aliiglaciecola sp. 3_MG-2023 TaxID=3062644 RepID=UPI0026E39E53|nr:tetratricopeptide repeat-containing sulfotransferase family protein [Aliiglaciecola sp. 3_MG-2023]MDO6694500.1 sulfotransferase [Aliiglaciecola sp. 3_MG-2023]
MNQFNANYHSLIQASLAANDLDKAAKLCTEGLSKAPNNAQLWVDLSEISMRLGQAKMTINSALKAINCEPNNIWNIFHLAGCYLHFQAFPPAVKALDKAALLLNDDCTAQQWDKLGELRYMANQLDLAIIAHSRALKIESDSKRSRNQLAALLRFKGDLSESEALYREVIALQPDNYQACYNLSQLRRFKSSDNITALLEDCKQRLTPEHKGHIMLEYAAGKVFEDVGDYQQAFIHYNQGAEIKRKQRPYDIAQDQALMKTVVALSETLQTRDANPTQNAAQTPIFVVGLPRTGTTLVERIIASHSKVVSGGELNAFPMALLEAGGKPIAAGLEGLDQDLIQKLTPGALTNMASRYLHLANNYVNNASYFVDKLPFNFLYCGLILQAIPNAKIVHVKRNPFDAALSNFKMLFDRGYEYSYSLTDTADFIAAYNHMMTQWKSQFPTQIHTIEYESLVSSQEQETEKLLAFCGLDWESECLNFHQNNSASQTASASQVREPIYSRSVNLWRHFQPQLTPLLDAFAKHGIKPTSTEEQ